MARKNREEHLTLPDLLGPGLRVLFVGFGFNPSVRAAELGHHYAGRGNGFWRLLAEAELTPRLLSPTEGGTAQLLFETLDRFYFAEPITTYFARGLRHQFRRYSTPA